MAARFKPENASEQPTNRVPRGKSPASAPPVARQPRVDMSPRLREELIAVGVFVLAIISALPALGLAEGSAIAVLGDGMRALLGVGRVLVPVALAILAAELWRAGPMPQRTRRLVGGIVGALSMMGLAGLDQANPMSDSLGGIVGAGIGQALSDLFSVAGSAIILLALFLAALLLISGLDLRSMGTSYQGRRRERAARHAALAVMPVMPQDVAREPVYLDVSSTQELEIVKPANARRSATPPQTLRAQTESMDIAFTAHTQQRRLVPPITGSSITPAPTPASVPAATGATRRATLVPAATATVARPAPAPSRARPEIRLPSDTAKPTTGASANLTLPLDDDETGVIGGTNLPRESAPRTRDAAHIKRSLPSLEMLQYYESSAPEESELQEKARQIETTLESFRVEAHVREIFPGPAVTQFTLQPGPGVKVRRITELQNDLALALAAPSIRIEAPVPGMARVGVEIPNGTISTVGLRETLESPSFARSSARLPLPLGRDVNGRHVIGDLTRMPHMLIAGSTGSGKSVCINSIVATFLLTKTPEELRMVMIDPKMVELSGYDGVPHLLAPVVTDMNRVVPALRAVLREMERRYQLFSRLGVRNIDGYELRRSTESSLEKMPYIVLIIDELADLMMTTPDEVETILVRLCQMARATGIHVLIATQRPSVDVLTGLIKANVPARVAFAVASQTDSRVILDMPGAERLLGRGDMLFMPADAAKPSRVQGSFIDDVDLGRIVSHWRLNAPETVYEDEWMQGPDTAEEDEDDDPLMAQALSIVRQAGTASASMLQRRLRIGYNRAARLIEAMEADGIIGPADGARSRPVLDDDFGE